jgi:hypothetical protein
MGLAAREVSVALIPECRMESYKRKIIPSQLLVDVYATNIGINSYHRSVNFMPSGHES